MTKTARYFQDTDGTHWLCIEDAIEYYKDEAEKGTESALALVRFLDHVLAFAQEHSAELPNEELFPEDIIGIDP